MSARREKGFWLSDMMTMPGQSGLSSELFVNLDTGNHFRKIHRKGHSHPVSAPAPFISRLRQESICAAQEWEARKTHRQAKAIHLPPVNKTPCQEPAPCPEPALLQRWEDLPEWDLPLSDESPVIARSSGTKTYKGIITIGWGLMDCRELNDLAEQLKSLGVGKNIQWFGPPLRWSTPSRKIANLFYRMGQLGASYDQIVIAFEN